jgi:hypothetical protein
MRFQIKYNILLVVFFLASYANGQDIEPRRWSSLPLGTQVIGAGYAHSFGTVTFDPLLQADDVTVAVNTFVASYVRPFKLGDKLARLDITLPYNIMRFEGSLSGAPSSVERNGFGDSRIRVSVNLIGPPASNAQELGKYLKENPKNTTVGVSMALTVPTGQYFDEKLINIGQNRFIIRPQFGMIHNWNNWSYELTGSLFIFSNNNDFFGAQTKKQDPVFALQTHLIKHFNSKVWASVSASYGIGGESIVNGVSNADLRTNFLSSAAFGFKLTKFQSCKIAYLNSVTLKDLGSNTHSFIIGWSHIIL